MKNQYKAKPTKLPKPTYWPFFLALGLVILLAGILSNIIVSLIGLIVFVVALYGWLSDLYDELKSNKNEL